MKRFVAAILMAFISSVAMADQPTDANYQQENIKGLWRKTDTNKYWFFSADLTSYTCVKSIDSSQQIVCKPHYADKHDKVEYNPTYNTMVLVGRSARATGFQVIKDDPNLLQTWDMGFPEGAYVKAGDVNTPIVMLPK